jgi:hypothetical protein
MQSTSQTSFSSYNYRLYINPSGNVGIGTTSPSRLLSLGGTAYIDMVLKSTSASGASGGGTIYFGNSSTDSSGILNYDHGGNYMNFFTAGSERMRITSDGNVGIGTTIINEKLDVEGNMNLRNSGTYSTSLTRDIVYRSSTASFGVQPIANITFLTTGDAASALSFSTRNGAADYAERMRITGGGIINGYSTSSNSLGLINTHNVSGDVGIYMEMGANTNNTSSFYFVGAQSGFGNRIQICGNGNLQNSNNSYGGISDIKLKENITDATPKLASLLQVKIRNYNLIGDDTKQIGVVAQELEQIFPSMVDEAIDYDKEGNDLGTTTKTVKYSVFVPMLIKAIQEQQAQIEELKAKIK